MTHLVLMTFLNSSNAGLLDVDTMMETILLHMMILLDDPKLCLGGILHDDANLAVLLLVDCHDATHDVVHDPNCHDEVVRDATLLLLQSILPNDPIPLMG